MPKSFIPDSPVTGKLVTDANFPSLEEIQGDAMEAINYYLLMGYTPIQVMNYFYLLRNQIVLGANLLNSHKVPPVRYSIMTLDEAIQILKDHIKVMKDVKSAMGPSGSTEQGTNSSL